MIQNCGSPSMKACYLIHFEFYQYGWYLVKIIFTGANTDWCNQGRGCTVYIVTFKWKYFNKVGCQEILKIKCSKKRRGVDECHCYSVISKLFPTCPTNFHKYSHSKITMYILYSWGECLVNLLFPSVW